MPSFQPPDSNAVARFLQFLGMDTRQPFGQGTPPATLTPASLTTEGAAATVAAPPSRTALPDLSGLIKAITTTTPTPTPTPTPAPGPTGPPPITWTDQFGRPTNPVPIGYGNRLF